MSSSFAIWDYATNQYVKWSPSSRCWVDAKGARLERAPQRTPNAAPSLPMSAPISSSMRATATSSLGHGEALQATTDSLRSLTIGHASQQSTSLPPGPIQSPRTRGTAPYNATVSDSRTGMRTRWEVSETHQYRDPRNENSNRSLNVKRIRQVENRPGRSSLDPDRDYKPCRVIEVLLVPPEDRDVSNVSRITPTETAGPSEVRLRRFVIIRQVAERNAFEALAIKTYYGRGVAAPGVIKSHHSIIFTGKMDPARPDEVPGRTPSGHLESGMLSTAIKVVSHDRGKALDPMSRLDYADRYEFDWGVSNIRLFGTVHDDWQAALFLQYNAVWSRIMTAVQGTQYGPQSMYTTQSSTNPTALTIPSVASQAHGGSSTAATVGSSARQGGTAASSASGTNISELPAAATLLQRFAQRNSGPCTPEQMSVIIQYLQEYARRSRLPPPTVSAQQVRDLARSAEVRANYIRQIRDRWHVARAQASSEEEDSDDLESDEE